MRVSLRSSAVYIERLIFGSGREADGVATNRYLSRWSSTYSLSVYLEMPSAAVWLWSQEGDKRLWRMQIQIQEWGGEGGGGGGGGSLLGRGDVYGSINYGPIIQAGFQGVVAGESFKWKGISCIFHLHQKHLCPWLMTKFLGSAGGLRRSLGGYL